ncbi:hypothetical protein ACERK3_06960 [Phycisphaerales bacterium AB-hyl4]|uniref:Uncharacterized protein n=1 Tax=Natronomicrosphaera hydrolytica TaxID=3242702 RepID=A0ABV4U5F2_9BACT
MKRQLPMPDYALTLLHKQMCMKCGAGFTRDHVSHIGICHCRGGHYFFYATVCSKCEESVTVIVTTQGEMTVQRLADELGGQVQGQTEDAVPREGGNDLSPSPSAGPPPRPIGAAEVERFLAVMHKAKTYEEVLRAIGMTSKEIRKYRYKRS